MYLTHCAHDKFNLIGFDVNIKTLGWYYGAEKYSQKEGTRDGFTTT